MKDIRGIRNICLACLANLELAVAAFINLLLSVDICRGQSFRSQLNLGYAPGPVIDDLWR